MAGQEFFDILPPGPWKQGVEGRAQMLGGDGGETRFAHQMRREPGGVGGQSRVGEIRPAIAQGLVDLAVEKEDGVVVSRAMASGATDQRTMTSTPLAM